MRKVPDWNTYFMGLAKEISKRSKDPETQVGSCLVDMDNHIIGTGFNGFPTSVPETPELWERPIKYSIVRHSEDNCIKHSLYNRIPNYHEHSRLYSTMYPCIDCCKLLLGFPIKEIYYLDDKYKSQEAETLFSICDVKVIKLEV